MVESENWRGAAPLISISLVILLPRCWAGLGWAETGDKVSYIYHGRHHRIQSGVAQCSTWHCTTPLLSPSLLRNSIQATLHLQSNASNFVLLETPDFVLIY